MPRSMNDRVDDIVTRLTAALAGRYTIEREIGRGGMGRVYLAQDVKHHRPVAIKVLRQELAVGSGGDRFVREIETASRLRHPHILPLHDSGEADGLLYYVMPHVEGESLRDRLNREAQLPVDDALRIAREVADALSYAHGRGLVHRDIKPENILLEAGHAVVTDFGIVWAIADKESTLERLTDVGITVGTPAYMSPEQAAGDRHLDARSDIYSLGCVLYEMLTGEPPFTGPTPQTVMARRQAELPRSLRVVRPAVPLEVERAIETALAKVPADRFATAAEFARILERIAQRQSGGRWPGVRRRRVAAAALAAGALVTLVVIAQPWESGQSSRGAGAGAGVGVVIQPFELSATAGESERRRGADAHLLLADALKWMPGLRVVRGAAGPDARADFLVRGTLLSVAGGWRVTADLYDARNGTLLLKSEAQGGGAEPDRPIARVAHALATDVAERRGLTIGPPSDLLTATTSAAAVGHLLAGQARFWRGDVDAAAAAFRAAVEADSACLLAYHRWSVAEMWRHDDAAALAAVEAGLAREGQSSPRWAALLRAQRHYVRAQSDSAIAAFQGPVLDRPGEIDAWLGLGEALFHFGGLAGHRPVDALAAFEHVVALDSTFAPIYDHLVDVALLQGDAARARRHLGRLGAGDPSRPPREAALAVWFGSRAARADAMRALQGADRRTISDLVSLLMHEAFDLPLADTVAGFLLGPDRTPDDRRRGASYRLVAALGQGRSAGAVGAWEGVAGQPRFDAWVVQAHLAGHAAPLGAAMLAWAGAAVDRASTAELAGPPSDELPQAWQAVVHQATLEGDSLAVRRLLDRTGRVGADAASPVPAALAASLQARLALLARDTARAIGWLEHAASRNAPAYATFFPLSTMAPQRLLLAELHAARGEWRQSERWLDSFSHTWSLGDVLYAARVQHIRSRLGS